MRNFRRMIAGMLILAMLLPALAQAQGQFSPEELRRQQVILQRVNRFYGELLEPYGSVEAFYQEQEGLVAFYWSNVRAMQLEYDETEISVDKAVDLLPMLVEIALEELRDFDGLIDWVLQESVDAAEDLIRRKLETWAGVEFPPFTKAEFIYAQLYSLQQVINFEDTRALMERAEQNGGHFTDVGDAIAFVNGYLRDQTGVVTLEMASNFYFERKREPGALKGIRVVEDVLLSLMSTVLAGGEKLADFFVERLVSRVFKGLDFIATAYNDTAISEWTRELKEIEMLRNYFLLSGVFSNPEDWEDDWAGYDPDAWDGYYGDEDEPEEEEEILPDGDGLVPRGPECLDEYLGIWALVNTEGSVARLAKDESGAYVLNVSIYRIASFEAVYTGADEEGFLVFESADGTFSLALYQDWMSLYAEPSDGYLRGVYDFDQEFICARDE